MSELKITTEAVKAAAAKCPDAKRVLETLFPSVFEPENKRLEITGHKEARFIPIEFRIGNRILRECVQVRKSSTVQMNHRGLYLTSDLDWRLEQDKSYGTPSTVLVAYEKGTAPKE